MAHQAHTQISSHLLGNPGFPRDLPLCLSPISPWLTQAFRPLYSVKLTNLPSTTRLSAPFLQLGLKPDSPKNAFSLTVGQERLFSSYAHISLGLDELCGLPTPQ